MIPFFWNVYITWRSDKKVEVDDPWGFGASLEWATSCPPPRHNFTSLPRIRSERPALDLHHPELAQRLHRRRLRRRQQRRSVTPTRRTPHVKIESWIFGLGAFFFVPCRHRLRLHDALDEWVGFPGAVMLVGRPVRHDRRLPLVHRHAASACARRTAVDAEIHEGAGEQGHFSPWSWWPLVLGLACAAGFLGLAVGWWIVFIAVGLAIVALIGWVYEYSRGDHAH